MQWDRIGYSCIALLLGLMTTTEASAMGKLCLFSAVQGVVLSQGQPVSDALVSRQFNWAWGKENGADETRTNAAGEFSLPAIFRNSLTASFLPHQPFIEQTILLKYQNREYKAWLFDKMDYEENSELGGKPISLRCSLENEPSRKNGVYGICELR